MENPEIIINILLESNTGAMFYFFKFIKISAAAATSVRIALSTIQTTSHNVFHHVSSPRPSVTSIKHKNTWKHTHNYTHTGRQI